MKQIYIIIACPAASPHDLIFRVLLNLLLTLYLSNTKNHLKPYQRSKNGKPIWVFLFFY